MFAIFFQIVTALFFISRSLQQYNPSSTLGHHASSDFEIHPGRFSPSSDSSDTEWNVPSPDGEDWQELEDEFERLGAAALPPPPSTRANRPQPCHGDRASMWYDQNRERYNLDLPYDFDYEQGRPDFNANYEEEHIPFRNNPFYPYWDVVITEPRRESQLFRHYDPTIDGAPNFSRNAWRRRHQQPSAPYPGSSDEILHLMPWYRNNHYVCMPMERVHYTDPEDEWISPEGWREGYRPGSVDLHHFLLAFLYMLHFYVEKIN